MTTYERRSKLIKILNARRFEKIDNLAFELNVTRRTIEKDLCFLSMEYPIYTMQGRNGGVEVMEGSSLVAIGLNREETALLQKLLVSAVGEDYVILARMLKKYGGK